MHSEATDHETARDLTGSFIDASGVAHFRAWSPDAGKIDVVGADGLQLLLSLRRGSDGYFVGSTDQLAAGTLYMYRVDEQGPWPDPWSRFQPQGPHGPSQLVTQEGFRWTDDDWPGISLARQVLYELHVGTFTSQGTFDAARERLRWLKDIGITLIELMPVAEFAGRWNWGYDGVQLYAPFHGYGDRDALKRFVDAAHACGLGVILDVVYNHLGPDGNYLRCFSQHFFSTKHGTEWGEAFNFDGPHAAGARQLVSANPAYWVREFHLDGFRLDATHSILDDSDEHVVTALTRFAREAAMPRRIVVIAENEPQQAEHLKSAADGGQGLDALWNDDFHHVARVALTGSRDGYFHDYTGRAQEFVSAVRHGFLYQGQYFHWQKQRRGSPLRRMPAAACVHFLQNHDQVGNTYRGARLHSRVHAGRYRALTGVLLLGPQTPLLFMGQEFSSSRPFDFFVDHSGALAQAISDGRRQFMKQFRAYDTAAVQDGMNDPVAETTFMNARLDWREADMHVEAVALHRDLLRIRRDDPVIAAQDSHSIDGAVLSEHAFVLRWFDDVHGDRLLVVNLDLDLLLDPNPEPLLAPQRDSGWQVVWASESPRYGGAGAIDPVNAVQQWRIQANSATLLRHAG
ncbi:malto-oligosyltrehalose trehalohydrolase [Povalibacter sp.]|uniref:malto-oligosyltrehalose trehalohydrolase n=1 Tax=Povalibacter sp. TaxID=1962978 RepID=UPI002F419670